MGCRCSGPLTPKTVPLWAEGRPGGAASQGQGARGGPAGGERGCGRAARGARAQRPGAEANPRRGEKAREERRRLQEEKDNWELEKARMRDQITGEVRAAEERRASKQAQIQLERAARDHQTELREKDNYIEGLKKELEAAHRTA